MRQLMIILIYFLCLITSGQEIKDSYIDKDISFGVNLSLNGSYNDKAYNIGIPFSFIVDYKLKNDFSIQFAPKYTWLYKWNEHYLTIPLHLKKDFGEKIEIYVGPALTFDLGYFKDLGISAGILYQVGNRSSLILSAYTFTLYDYHIDYFYLPIGVSYNFVIINKK